MDWRELESLVERSLAASPSWEAGKTFDTEYGPNGEIVSRREHTKENPDGGK